MIGPLMVEPLVKVEISEGLFRITLDRPAKRNALSHALVSQLTAAVARAAGDASTRLVVVSANGPAFCAGMDLDEMQGRADAPNADDEWDKDAADYRDLLVAILKLDVPTLAVVQGPAIAGGFGLVLACDLVLASSAARFALPEPKRGISPAVVSPLLIYRIGVGPATPLLLAGQVLTAEAAFRVGLCHMVSPPEKLDASREEFATPILAGAPQALAMTKRLVRSFALATLLEQLEAGRKVSAEARCTPEAREGLAAFLEKREPSWYVPPGRKSV
ncbi:MAG TPA: enoyl-CoA hydratase-related protein [Planctomycetaceae bacterium]|nr:enoyl-CoA hydratase-related protein [Planctomycetaceae bacterium]